MLIALLTFTSIAGFSATLVLLALRKRKKKIDARNDEELQENLDQIEHNIYAIKEENKMLRQQLALPPDRRLQIEALEPHPDESKSIQRYTNIDPLPVDIETSLSFSSSSMRKMLIPLLALAGGVATFSAYKKWSESEGNRSDDVD